MSAQEVNGVLSFSIDSDDAGAKGVRHADEVESVVTEILARFNEHEMVASWAFPNPAASTLARQIAHGAAPHDLALLAPDDQKLAGDDLSRMLVRRIHAANAAGITVSTIAARRAWNVGDVDLLMKQGIRVVRGVEPINEHGRRTPQAAKRGAQSLRYGLWHFPVTASIRGGGWLANVRQFSRARRMIDSAARRGGLCHIHLDGAALAAGDVSMSLRMLDRLLRHLDTLRATNRVIVEHLPDVGRRLLPQRTIPAAHSILRAA